MASFPELDPYIEQGEALVVDRWVRIQATARQAGVLAQVRELTTHQAFDQSNPNKVYSLILAFAKGNPTGFHGSDGAGYQFVADWIRRLDSVNPQVAARMVSTFNQWKTFAEPYAALMQKELQRIEAKASLSKDVREIVSKALA